MFRATSLAMTISMTMALGAKSRSTGMCGIPMMSALIGRLTVTVTGIGSPLGDGPGWAMSLGALRLTTMAAGHLSEAVGVGALDRSLVLRFMVRPLLVGSAEAGALDSVLAWAGSRWAGASRSSPGSAAAAALSR